MATPSIIAYSVNLISDLIGLTGSTNDETILLLGYNSINDGGGGEFYWDSSSTQADDGGSVIQPTGVMTGRWVRIFYTKKVNVRFFGAVGDGLTDDLTAINNAIVYCATNNYVLTFDNTTYYLSDTLNIFNSIDIQCNQTTLKTNYPTSKASPIILINNVTGFSLAGQLTLLANTTDQTNTQTDGLVITNSSQFYIDTIITNCARFGVQLGACTDAILNNIEGYNNKGYQSTPSNGGSVINFYCCNNLRIKQVVGVNCWKSAIYLSVTSNDINNENIQIDSADIQLAEGSTIANGIGIRSCINLQVGNLRVNGGISAVYTELNTANHIVRDIHFDSVIATNCTVVTSVSNAIRIVSISPAPAVTNFKIDKVAIDGGDKASIFILNAKNVYVGASTITNIPSNGIYIEDSDQVHFDYINISNCQTHGILTGGTVANVYINNYYFEDIGSGDAGVQVVNGSLTSCYINNITGRYTSSQHLYCFYYAIPNSSDQLQIGNIANIGGSGGAAFYRATVFPVVKNSFFCRAAAPTSTSSVWNAGDFILSTNSGTGSEYGFRCITTGSPGTWVKVSRVLNSGVSTQSGNGTLVSFAIAHGLGAAPTFMQVQAGSAAAVNIQYISADATNITVHFTTAPATGTNNLTFYWEARA
ncbi:MAG: hypothetical protein ACTHMI_22300 [Mucilaginibacter sp.]